MKSQPQKKEKTSGRLDDLEFISHAAARLTEIDPNENIFDLVASEIAAIAPRTLVVANSYDPGNEMTTVRALAGPLEMKVKGSALLNTELLNLTFTLNEEARKGMVEGALIRLEEGLHQLTFRSLPIEVCRMVETNLGIRSVYVQPFVRKGDFLGTVALISKASTLKRARLIETYIRQVAVTLQRRKVESQLRESERRFRTLAESLQDVVFRIRLRPHRNFEYINPAVAMLVDYSPRNFYEEPYLIDKLVHPDDADILAAALQNPPPDPFVIRWRGKDGQYISTEQRVTPVESNEGEAVVVEGIARDVTDRERAEKALREADRRKNEFLAVLSHELRNPLSPIVNSLFILNLASLESRQAKRALSIIERQISYMTRLIDDLLDVTRISRGKIQLQRELIPLNELVRKTVEDHRVLFETNRIALDFRSSQDSPFVEGDRTRLAQVIGNLLQNAAKYTSAGGTVDLSVIAYSEQKEAVVQIRDSGVGIAPEVLSHLFEPFMQADRTLERSKGGLGLGLALVKGLVEMHNGRVIAQSEGLGKGAVFTVWLPLRAVPVLSAPLSVHRPLRRASRRVLIIEDNLDAAETLREVLVSQGHEVNLAHTGTEGLRKASVFKPEVVLCDIGLPGIDGYSVARTIRADPQMQGVRLVALTGYAGNEDLAKSKKAGFDQHITKPANIEILDRCLFE